MTDFDKVIPPGSEGKVYASVDISHIKGSVQKSVDIETNDPVRKTTRLTVKANIKTYVDITPMEMVHFAVNKGETETQEVTLTPNYKGAVGLHDAVVDSDMFDVKLEPVAGSTPPQYKLKVMVKDAVKVGKQEAKVKIAVDGMPIKELTVPVVATVKGPISVMPPTVVFRVKTFPDEVTAPHEIDVHESADSSTRIVTHVQEGAVMQVIAQTPEWFQVLTDERAGWLKKTDVTISKPATPPSEQIVSLQKAGGKNFKVLEYHSALPQVKVEMDPENNGGKNYSLKIMLEKWDQPKGNSGTVKVMTDDTDQPEVTIPVYIIVS